MYSFLQSLIVVVFFTLGDSAATKFFDNHQWWWMVGGVLFNAIGVALFGYIAHREGVADTSGLVLTLNIVGNILLGALYFGDKLSIMHYVGLCFGIIGIIILSYY